MRIEFRLKSLLQAHDLDKPGIFVQIGREAGISRKIVSGLYHNRRISITFNQLERLCQWLHNKGVPDRELPGALFGFYPSRLVNALTAAGWVRIYPGEYCQRQAAHIPRFWVSWADSEVASLFVELLSGAPPADGDTAGSASSPRRHQGLRFEYVHVPSHDAPFGEASAAERPATEPTEPARRIFRAMREDESGTTNILIGSQRANLLVELFVADLFGCEPFADAKGRLPFYLYRESSTSSPIPSCFGGSELPADCPSPGRLGIYY
ncbi:MAG: helix-turn-helix domain-containing protein, partial [Planctomycetota bacterium]